MKFWTPDPGEPALLEWWQPLTAVARLARADQISWQIHPDEFMFMGKVDRTRRPAVWLYKHVLSRGYINADVAGVTYEWVEYRSGPSEGRYKQIALHTAIWRCGLPDVVEPVWYEPPPHRYEPDIPLDPFVDPATDAPVAAAAPRRRRRRSHLRLVGPA